MHRTIPKLALVAVLLTTTLGGCAQLTKGATFVDLKPKAAASVTVPRECQRHAKRVPDPGAKVGDDGFDIAARYKGAWLKANRRLGAVRRCEDKQADTLAKGGR